MNKNINELERAIYASEEEVKQQDFPTLKNWENLLTRHLEWWEEEGRYCNEGPDWEEESDRADFAEDVLGLIRARIKELEKEGAEWEKNGEGMSEIERIKDEISSEEDDKYPF